jgi:hypothetical protein
MLDQPLLVPQQEHSTELVLVVPLALKDHSELEVEVLD